jgi:nitrite reductase (NADH) small subunit
MAEMLVTPTINLGRIEAIPLGQGRCYTVATEEIAVFRQRDGRLFAIQNRCPHRQGPLAEGLVGNNKVICPLHAHQFNLETGSGNEAAECLHVYDLQEVEGNMLLSFEKRF